MHVHYNLLALAMVRRVPLPVILTIMCVLTLSVLAYAYARIRTRLQHPRIAGGLTKLLPHISEEAVDLLHKLLVYDPGEQGEGITLYQQK